MLSSLRSTLLRVGLAGGCLGLLVVATTAGTSHAASTQYYLSLGDSYSVGYQPVPLPDGAATSGYTGYVASHLGMQLVNYGCGGATTTSILDFTGTCGAPDSYGPPAATDAGTIPAGDTQVTAAEAFIKAHPGQIGLITISIGGNDVTPCINASVANPVNGQTSAIPCVVAGIAAIKTNVETLAKDLRTAAGPKVRIIGLTYPDVLLGLWVYPTEPASSADTQLAELSVTAFHNYINPDLKAAYKSVKGKFVDITKDTGGYKFKTTKVTS
ncbi:MAG TPA: GDSL-type esterase/lipase family protein, partial [Acidimicrobiales bacterium]|nr:GDSL-type esterase/lipase family protein [Acidimicrobiales bacterium]